jgi:hypothetical protein
VVHATSVVAIKICYVINEIWQWYFFLFHKACRMRKMEKIKKVGKRRNERRILSSLFRQVKKKCLEVEHYGWRVTWFVALCRPPRRFCLTGSFLTAICHLLRGLRFSRLLNCRFFVIEGLSAQNYARRCFLALGSNGKTVLRPCEEKSCTTWLSVRNQMSISVA